MKACQRCKVEKAEVYGGRYPRRVCDACREATRTRERARSPQRHIPLSTKALVYAEANGLCAQCGIHCRWVREDRYDRGPDTANIDHIFPVLHGGERNRQNLQLLCARCNSQKGSRLPS